MLTTDNLDDCLDIVRHTTDIMLLAEWEHTLFLKEIPEAFFVDDLTEDEKRIVWEVIKKKVPFYDYQYYTNVIYYNRVDTWEEFDDWFKKNMPERHLKHFRYRK